jgi:DNA-binding transcriptional MerR regulator
MYTVRQLADLAGVTVRTLHHYDEIGLLKPSSVGGNGYRYYDRDALYRLQQILFYRELDIPLEDIKRLLEGRDFDILAALRTHRAALQAEAKRLKRLIGTIDKTTLHLKGKATMTDKQLFRGFSEAEQEQLADEAARRWDSTTVRESNARWKQYPPEKKQRIMDEGNALYTDLIAAMPEGPASARVQAIVARWHEHMQYFWSPRDEQLLGLADLYNQDPRFHANFEAMQPGLSAFMREAVQEYVAGRKVRNS